jgi:drug/metabolite transporter (DMT)-like permease
MTATPATVVDRRSYGIGILLFAQLFFTGLDSCAKWLAISSIPTAEIIFIRYAVHVALAIAMFLPLQGFALFRTGDWKLEAYRGACLLGITFANFFAMQFLPLTVTGAIFFTMPLFVTLLSGPMLGETVGWRRWLAVLVGFAGVLIIIRPGTEAFHPASLLCFAGALCAALFAIITRKLAGIDTAATQQVYSGVFALVLVTPFALTEWVWPTTGSSWFAFWAAGVFGMLAHLLNAVALRYASPAVLAPFSYTGLLLLAVSSWLTFGQPPDAAFYAGAPLIILSGLYIWLRERRLQKAATSLAPVED